MKSILSIAFFILIISCLRGNATTPDRLNNGSNQIYNIFSNCKQITNATGKDILVPNGSTAEWTVFLAHLPTGVSSATCPANPTFRTQRNCTYCNSLTKPTGLAVGDLMIAQMYVDTNFTGVTAPSGFNILDSSYSIGGSAYKSQRWYKIADASDVAATNFVFTKSGGWTSTYGYILAVFKDVNQTTPIQDHSVNSGTSATITYTGKTATINNSLIVVWGETSVAPGAPTGYSTDWTDGTQGMSISSKVLATAAATGSPTIGIGSSYPWAGGLMIINPL